MGDRDERADRRAGLTEDERADDVNNGRQRFDPGS